MLIAVCSERSSCPCLCSGVVWLAHGKCEVMARYHIQMAYEGFKVQLPRKEKYRHAVQAKDFVGWNRRQNESGVLRGGEFFRDNPRRGSVQNEHDHILWKGSNQSTRAVGFTRKIPLCVKIVKRVLKNLLKWSKKSMTHLVALGKNTLCESEQTPFSVCGRSFYCRQQQDVAFLTIV